MAVVIKDAVREAFRAEPVQLSESLHLIYGVFVESAETFSLEQDDDWVHLQIRLPA